jgi:hypothetical protein
MIEMQPQPYINDSQDLGSWSFGIRSKYSCDYNLSTRLWILGGVCILTSLGCVSWQLSVLSEQLAATQASIQVAQSDLTATESVGSPHYESVASDFVGGYMLNGEMFTVDGSIRSVYDYVECMCECNATAHGVFCRGANMHTSFFAIAERALESNNWHMNARAIGNLNYRLSMDFGKTPGGRHTQIGYTIMQDQYHPMEPALHVDDHGETDEPSSGDSSDQDQNKGGGHLPSGSSQGHYGGSTEFHKIMEMQFRFYASEIDCNPGHHWHDTTAESSAFTTPLWETCTRICEVHDLPSGPITKKCDL